ncbi:winged helix-turn-helix domain-containing protein [Bradyrhizobium japonicum]|uniref:ATP-binding protein n=1 Tax=Bradyrhizobium japonicum TaxID=375 RepID=UPI0004B32485|nr:winged helix-turn-helix domain-containing protein [Bradyrhizobium japonicum]MBR0727661.1 winged helix-turn-helix domain-containing protein [Bradyrhizobium japonicum]MBR0804913.1 winged helix-turn-helix domain-containing protein [Bradyrhizobium japonicum]
MVEQGLRAVYESNGWEIDLAQRELRSRGVSVPIGSRTFEILEILVRSGGELVKKRDLIDQVWPVATVEENTLHFHISAIRKALGADRELLKTVSGRGYRLLGIWTVRPATGPGHLLYPKESASAQPLASTNLPQPASALIGRTAEVEEISKLVRAHRLVTLTGAGGIGKTRLALAVARELLPHFPEGVWLVEFSPLADPSLVPIALAAAIGLKFGGGEISTQRVALALAARRLLVVMDTCEHVIDAAARMAEGVLRAGSSAQIIATSREPLRAEGEQVSWVQPLSIPTEDADDLLEYGAVRLFIERVRATEPGAVLDGHRAKTIAAICRRLDGIPLAIEMAAARVTALGVEELAAHLDDRFQLLTGGRTALPRHQTLRATFDWSYELLTEPELVLLRRLAVFAGAIDLEAICAVVTGAGIALPEVVDGISSLVSKSLVVAEIDATTARYRLLDTTHTYALEKLDESGERERLARRHAEYYRDLFERAEAELEMRPTVDWMGDYGRHIDNLRAALGWAFSPSGDVQIGAGLTAAAVPLCVHSSLLEECRGRVERAIAALGAAVNGDARLEMKLHTALGTTLIFVTDAKITALGEAWTKALELAERLDDVEHQLRSLLGLWFFHRVAGRLRASLTAAQRFSALAASRSNSNDRLIGERLIGISQHCLGDQPSARYHLERMLAHYVPPVQTSRISRFRSNQRVTAGAFLGRTLWLQGSPDRAMRVTETYLREATASRHVNSVCYIAANAACPIALWSGDMDLADHYVTRLIDLATRHSLMRYVAFARSHQGLLAIKRGDTPGGLLLLRSGIDELGDEVNASHRYFLFVGEMAEGLGRVGQVGEGLSVVHDAIARAEETEERLSIAELLRIKGELLLLQGAPGAAATAEDQFYQALKWASLQGALSWELRAATSLAQLFRDQDRPADAKALLQPIYDRFAEGLDTADLRRARGLLRDLG